MTLKTKEIIIDMVLLNGEPSRDNGKTFIIQEMAAIPASDWFLRAMQYLVRAGIDVPPHIFAAGPAGFVAIGIGTALTGLSKAPFFELKPMLDELLLCVKHFQAPDSPHRVSGWEVIKSQVEEPATLFLLYEGVVSLSLGFSLAEKLSNYRILVTKMMEGFSSSIETSMPE